MILTSNVLHRIVSQLTKILLSGFATLFGMLLFLSVLQLAQMNGTHSSHSVAYEVGLFLGKSGKLFVNLLFSEKGQALGCLLALITSWGQNRSVRWALLHAIFGWFYLGYLMLIRVGSDTKK